MASIQTAIKLFKEPRKFIRVLGDKQFFNWLPDKMYLKLVYWGELGIFPDFKNPKSFSEKIQWLKLYNRKPEYSSYADKYKVREYIKNRIGDEFLVPLIGVYDTIEQIEWEKLPDKFVLKCNHGSGCNIICHNKSDLDIIETKRLVKKWMKKNWYWFGREWVYKNMERKIIIEKLLEDPYHLVPNDYKFWVFNGKVKYINVHFKENMATKINIYNRFWEQQEYSMVYESNQVVKHEKPKNLDKMIAFAEQFGLESPFLRVDFYEVDNKIFFGEITFFPTSGFVTFQPNHYEIDRRYGDLLELEVASVRG